MEEERSRGGGEEGGGGREGAEGREEEGEEHEWALSEPLVAP